MPHDTGPDGDRPVDIWDETGKLVGRFYRTGLPYRPQGYVIEGEWLSDEEIDRRTNDGRWHSVAEMDAFLKELKRTTR